MNTVLMGRFLDVVEGVLENWAKLDLGQQEGCYICLATKEPRILLVAEFGACSDIKAFQYCQEKVLRVQRDKLVSSWQNRDRDKGQYGGAISVPTDSLGHVAGRNMIIGVSNFAEIEDEAVALVIALAMHWITQGDFNRIAEISGNNVASRLAEACSDFF